MAAYGHSPPTRIFEAAAAASCIITDQWRGIEMFLEPGLEVLVASDGEDVVEHLMALSQARQRAIGEAAQKRILAKHTYSHRIKQIEAVLENGDS
jgi:spore maturation protein CgeB